MDHIDSIHHHRTASGRLCWVVGVILVALVCPFNIFSDNPRKPRKPQKIHPVERRDSLTLPDSIPLQQAAPEGAVLVADSISAEGGRIADIESDTFAIVDSPAMAALPDSVTGSARTFTFNPDPKRAVWMAALFPGLGQAYNRRYWKLPLVAAGFMGLAYGTSWNNGMLRDYTRAYADIMDNDPNTKSYMDFFPSTIKEEDLDRQWLTNILKSRKDYYRRNRDLCIISMVGVYLLAMVDAYVDASLAHFDISPDISMQVVPAFIQDSRSGPGVGLHWAFTF